MATCRVFRQTGSSAAHCEVAVRISKSGESSSPRTVIEVDHVDHANLWKVSFVRGVSSGVAAASRLGIDTRGLVVTVEKFIGQMADTPDDLAEACTHVAVLRTLVVGTKASPEFDEKTGLWRVAPDSK